MSPYAKSDPMLQRIYAEFLEMPGLRVTCAQAQRLWALDELTCRRLLDVLVETNFLGCPAPGVYARLTEGPHQASPRMAKAGSTVTDPLRTKEAV